MSASNFLLRILFVMMMTWLFANNLKAQVTTYTDRTAWENALAALPTTNANFTSTPSFVDLCSGTATAGTHVFSSVSGCGGGQAIQILNSSATPELYLSGTGSGAPKAKVTIPASIGIGFDWQASATSSGGYNTFYVTVGSTTLLLNSSSTSGFFGYINHCETVTSYQLYSTVTNWQNFHSFNFSCSTTPFPTTTATQPTVQAASTTICNLTSTTLSVVSGTLNNATNWNWYAGGCGSSAGGTLVGTGTSVTVSPSATTTYYVRGEGPCTSPGVCSNIQINVTPLWYLDADGDGYYVGSGICQDNSPGSGYTTTVSGGNDCDDNDPNAVPGASIDPTFVTGSGASGITVMARQADGKIIIGGSFTSYNGTTVGRLARLNTNGTRDNTFTTTSGAISNINAIALQPDGKIIIAGAFLIYNGTVVNRIVRLNSNGTIDNTFAVGSGFNSNVIAMALQADGKLLAAGLFTTYKGTAANRIVRINTDGSMDNSFTPGTGPNGFNAGALAVQADGKIIIAGTFTSYNGTTLGRIARLNADGTIDGTFNSGTGLNNTGTTLVIQPDNKIIVGGAFTAYNSDAANRIIRLNTDGTIDNSFTTGSGFNSTVSKVILQPDNKIIAGGAFTNFNANNASRVARLNADGTMDNGLLPTPSNTVNAMLVQPDNKIILAGSFTIYSGIAANYIVRINKECTTSCVAPTIPTINASSTSICNSQSSTLSIASGVLNNATAWKWYSGSCGGTLVGTGVSINVSPAVTTTYYVRGEGACVTTGNCASITITVNPLPSTPTATVIQPTCSLATGTINVTAPLGEDCTYSIGGVYQSNPSFATVNPGTYTLSVQSNAGCVAAQTTTVTVDPQPIIPAAPTTTGFTNVCPYTGTGTQITYTASAVGATSYTWTIPPSNVSILSGQGTANLTVVYASGFPVQSNKQFRVSAGSACGSSLQTIFSTFTLGPVTPSPISGPTSVCELIGTATTATYSIPAVPAATEYNWTIPAGTSVTHPNGTGVNDTIIRLTFLPSFTGGTVSATALNNCGTSGTRSLTIGYAHASTPGLISGPVNSCPYILPSGAVATYSVVPVTGATSYTWTAPAGAIVTHPNGSGANDYTITVKYPAGFSSGTISVTATNGCGTSSPRSLSILKLNAATPSVIDVMQTGFCEDAGGRVYTYTLASMPANATSVVWTVPTADGAMILSGQGTTSIAVSYPSTPIDGMVTAQAFNNCDASTIRSTSAKIPACATARIAAAKTNNNVVEQSKKNVVVINTGEMEVKVFPNPTTSDFKLRISTSSLELIKVRVMDMEGRVLKQFNANDSELINTGADLKAGAYIMEVKQGNEVKTIKLLKF